MKPETQDPLSAFVPPLFGDKFSLPSREGRLVGLKELEKVKASQASFKFPVQGFRHTVVTSRNGK